MLATARRVLSYEMSVAEFVGLVVLVAIPYGAIGVVWTLTHTSHLADMDGVDLVISFLGSVVCWPVLTFSDVCMT
ncbi:MAG: hypothetical protein WAX14_03735 [Rhodococcus sp. (in: high G+C Gram-positive bacteria)]|uniref:hypothetical protein n=1 Tax=Rhodococcus sp. TaxID=1831 RepID=UPI003BB66770